MAAPSRETIMNALLALLQSRCADTFLTIQRRLILWEDLAEHKPPVAQPFLCLYDGMGLGGGVDVWEGRYGTPRVRIMHRTLVIYARFPGAGTPGGQLENASPGGVLFHPLIESIESAFATDDLYQNTLTLGGIVQHCWLEGDGHMLAPDMEPSGQGMLTMPVRIMIP